MTTPQLTNLSAFMDGELAATDTQLMIADLSKQAEQKNRWQLYHMTRDALHQEAELSIDVTARVMAALALEPTILSPQVTTLTRKNTPDQQQKKSRTQVRWQHPALAWAASLAGVAFVAWAALVPVKQSVEQFSPMAVLNQIAPSIASNTVAAAIGNKGKMADQVFARENQARNIALGTTISERQQSVAENQPGVGRVDELSAGRVTVALTHTEEAQVARLQEYLSAHRAYRGDVMGGSVSPIRNVSVVSASNDQR
ncbi:MAG: sigma-E factor negative regulatory protein [Rugosibacter sp.]|nr:sigma-E factor negative regulatory protein [Rugosibacter sp.]